MERFFREVKGEKNKLKPVSYCIGVPKEYVLVYQTIPRVETWYKEAADLWRIASAHGLDKSVYLHSLDLTIALKDIYKNIDNLNLDKEVVVTQVY